MKKKKRDTFLTCFLILLIINAVVVLSIFPYLTFIPNNYRDYNYNLVWDECGITLRKMLFPTETHYKIKGVPIREFIACERYQGGIGMGSDPVVMVRKGFEPQITLDISSAELYLHSGYISNEEWRSYASSTKKTEITKLNEGMARELAERIESGSAAYLDVNDLSERPVSIRNGEYHMLMLRFKLEEYDNILWTAKIVSSGDKYYVRLITSLKGKREYIPCSEELSELIDQAILDYGLTLSTND